MALLEGELQRIKYELGWNMLGVGAEVAGEGQLDRLLQLHVLRVVHQHVVHDRSAKGLRGQGAVQLQPSLA